MKKVTTCHFLNYKFCSVSDFASKYLALVRFWVKIITVCPAINWKSYNVSNFDSKIHHLSHFVSKVLQSVRFWLMEFEKCPFLSGKLQKTTIPGESVSQKFRWIVFVPQNWNILPHSCFFTGTFLEKNKVHCVIFVMKKVTTCQILN